jgi:hypothetical protein
LAGGAVAHALADWWREILIAQGILSGYEQIENSAAARLAKENAKKSNQH